MERYFGRLTTPVPGVQSTKFPDSPAGNLVPESGVPSTISPTQCNNFGPRIGIAYAFGVSGVRTRPAFAQPTVSTIWVPRTRVTSELSVTLHRASTGHRQHRPSLPAPTCSRDRVTQEPTSFFPSGGGRLTSSLGRSCLCTCPVTQQEQDANGRAHNLSIQRQLDRSPS